MSFQTLSFHNIQGQNSTVELGNVSEARMYQNSTLGIKIQNPFNWTIQENPFGSPGVVLLSAPENPSDKFSENLLLQIAPLGLFGFSKNVTKQEFDRYFVENQTKSYELELLGEKDTLLASLPAHEMQFTTNTDLLGGDIFTKLIWTIKDDKVYLVTITSKPDTFPDFESKFQSMLDSLRIS